MSAEQRETVLPAEFFDEFFGAVAAEPTAALVEAGERLWRYVIRDERSIAPIENSTTQALMSLKP